MGLIIPSFDLLVAKTGSLWLREKGDLAKQIPQVPTREEWDVAVYKADLMEYEQNKLCWELECAHLATLVVDGVRYADHTDADDVKVALRKLAHYASDWFYDSECCEENLLACMDCPKWRALLNKLQRVDPVTATEYRIRIRRRAYNAEVGELNDAYPEVKEHKETQL